MAQRNSAILKLPGLVDVHVHFREPGATHKEDFGTGTRAAIAGGFTQVLDMPNNNPPTVKPNALLQKEKLAQGKIWCDIGFNFGATTESVRYFKTVFKKTFGLKVYMNHTTGPLLVEKLKDRDLIFKSWEQDQPIMVHAEGETVEVAIKLAKKYKKKLHVCHVTLDQVKPIEKARKEGVLVTCEVTPHHLFLNKSNVKELGAFGIMKPPLISQKDQEKLWANLDKIDIIATDHAPHTEEEKQTQQPPLFGVPGLETMLPLMFTAVADGKLSTIRLIEMVSTNPRAIFNIPAQPDTYVLVDFSTRYKIGNKKFYTKCNWTPFAKLEGRGEIKKVVIRGKPVFTEGEFVGKPLGKVIYPQKS